jgi:hypothetical protein
MPKPWIAISRNLAGANLRTTSLFHFPQTSNQPLHAHFTEFPWRTDAALLKKWQRGTTGYPLMDAGIESSGRPGGCTIAGAWRGMVRDVGLDDQEKTKED